jgi:hypothetical protein
MVSSPTPVNWPDYRQLAVWLITIIIATSAYKYLKEIIVFVLGRLYEFFIQKNALL